MKPPSALDRFFMAIYHVFMLVIIVFWLLALTSSRLRLNMLRTSLLRPDLGAPIAAVMLLLSLRFLYLATIGRRGRRSVIHDLPLGRVRISLGAIESLVQRLTRTVRGIKECKAVVTMVNGGLSIRIKATVGPEVAIPETSGEIQQLVKHQVRSVAGIVVQEVEIDVKHITPEPKRGRVE